jgi:hydrogenase maturation protease
MKTLSRKEKNIKKICIVGIGNILRSDDGVGVLVCSELEKFKTPGVSIFSTQQLHIDLIEDFKEFDTIIVVDAGTDEKKDVSLYPVEEGKIKAIHSSHHVDAALLYTLSQKLYPSDRQFYLCAIRGESFKFGTTLSPSAITNAAKAVKLITDFINNKAA